MGCLAVKIFSLGPCLSPPRSTKHPKRNGTTHANEMDSGAMKIDAPPHAENIDNCPAVAPMTTLEIVPISPTKSASGSVKTETSTIEFGHEPYETYQQRVKDLCRSLWPDSARRLRVNSLLSGRVVGLLHGTKFLQSVWPAREFSIERLRGGGFNRVIAITITSTNRQEPTRLILRVPRFDDAKPEREVGILRYVAQHTSIPVAKIRNSDFTSDNALESPYVIQYRIPGNDLQRPSSGLDYPSLSFQQQCTIAREFGAVLRKLLETNNSTPGRIEASGCQENFPVFKIRPFEVKLNPLMDDSELDEASHAASVPLHDTTLAFFESQFERWRDAALDSNPLKVLYMNKLSAAASQLHEAGYLGNGQNSLCHLDLNGAPRNVMARINTDERLAITGILDWDDAIFAPRFVGCAPSMWLWQWDRWVDDPEDESMANDTPTCPKKQELKRIWEEAVGPEFVQMAYALGYRLARRLFQWALNGIHSTWEMKAADEWLDDWAAIRPENTPQIKRVLRADVDSWSLATDSDQESHVEAEEQQEVVGTVKGEADKHEEDEDSNHHPEESS